MHYLDEMSRQGTRTAMGVSARGRRKRTRPSTAATGAGAADDGAFLVHGGSRPQPRLWSGSPILAWDPSRTRGPPARPSHRPPLPPRRDAIRDAGGNNGPPARRRKRGRPSAAPTGSASIEGEVGKGETKEGGVLCGRVFVLDDAGRWAEAGGVDRVRSKIVGAGGEVKSNVSRNTNYLLLGPCPKRSARSVVQKYEAIEVTNWGNLDKLLKGEISIEELPSVSRDEVLGADESLVPEKAWKCRHDGCPLKAVCGGLCARHSGRVCTLEGCDHLVRSKVLCGSHGRLLGLEPGLRERADPSVSQRALVSQTQVAGLHIKMALNDFYLENERAPTEERLPINVMTMRAGAQMAKEAILERHRQQLYVAVGESGSGVVTEGQRDCGGDFVTKDEAFIIEHFEVTDKWLQQTATEFGWNLPESDNPRATASIDSQSEEPLGPPMNIAKHGHRRCLWVGCAGSIDTGSEWCIKHKPLFPPTSQGSVDEPRDKGKVCGK